MEMEVYVLLKKLEVQMFQVHMIFYINYVQKAIQLQVKYMLVNQKVIKYSEQFQVVDLIYITFQNTYMMIAIYIQIENMKNLKN